MQNAAANLAAKDGNSSNSDAINMQMQYLRPVLGRPTTILVRTVRATKAIFTVHVALAQDGKECAVGYVKCVQLMASRPILYHEY